MGFFSELKSDLSTAVNTVKPEDTELEENGTAEVAEEKKDLDIGSMIDHLDQMTLEEAPEETEDSFEKEETFEEAAPEEENVEEAPAQEVEPEQSAMEIFFGSQSHEPAYEEIPQPEPVAAPEPEVQMTTTTYNDRRYDTMDTQQMTPTDETASITAGMSVTGNITTTGSLDLLGKVTGDVTVYGKLNVSGEIEGDSDAAEIYAEGARITGEVRSQGSIKVGESSVIIGNLFATSAVIAGAVKGDIDVQGPVVLDTTAIVMGNIKSQSVQINNGAVIEGMCSQVYAEVNPSAFFEGLKK